MENQTFGLNIKVNGHNEMANAIKSIGQAINAIDFDKISEIAGIGVLVSNLKSTNMRFDVTTGPGLEKAIKETRNLIKLIVEAKELRDAFYATGGETSIKNFERLAQSSVKVPRGMTSVDLSEKMAQVKSYINNTKDNNISKDGLKQLEDLYEMLEKAKKFVDSGNAKGKFLDEDIRKWIGAWNNFESYVRDSLVSGVEKFAGMRGMVGDTVTKEFQKLSQETRDQVVAAYDVTIKKTRQQLKDLHKEQSKLKAGESTSVSEAKLSAISSKIGVVEAFLKELTTLKEEFTRARVFLTKEEKDSIRAQGATKNIQAVKSQFVVKEASADLQKEFKDILFVNNRASAKQVVEVLERKEKDLVDYLTKSKPYLMTEEQKIAHAQTIMEKSQELLKYRYLAQMKDVVVTDREFKAMQKGQSIYKVPMNFDMQTLDTMTAKIKNFGYITKELDSLLNKIETFKFMTKEHTPGEKLPLDTPENRRVGKELIEFSQLTKEINAAIRSARKELLLEAKTPYTASEKSGAIFSRSEHWRGVAREERDTSIVRLREERDQLVKDIQKIENKINGVNKLADKQHIEKIRQLSKELEFRRIEIKAIQEANRLDTKAKQDSAKEKKDTKEQEKKPKEDTSQQEKKNKLKKEEVDYDLQLEAIDQKLLIAQGQRVDLAKVYMALKQQITRLKELDDILTNKILTSEQESLLLAQAELDAEKAETYEEAEQIRQSAKERVEESKVLSLKKEEFETERKQTQMIITRLNVMAQTNKAHKQTIGSILNEYLSLNKIIARMSFVWTAMFSYGMANQIRSIVSEAKQAAIELETVMQRIKSVMSTFEKSYAEVIKKNIVTLSRVYGKSIGDIGNATYETMSSNFAPAFGSKLVEQATRMATAGLSSVEDATNLLIGAVNSYGISVNELTTISDIFFQTVRYGRVTIEQLSKNFSTVASTGALLGINFRDITAAIALMTNQGIDAEQAMTSLNRLLTNFARGGTKESIEIAHQLGIEMNSNAIKTEGLVGLFRKLKGATEQQIMALSGNVRAFKVLAAGINDTTTYQEFFNRMSNSVGTTQEALNEIMDSSAFKLEKSKKAMIANFLVIAEDFIPVIVTLQNIMTSLSKTMGIVTGKVYVTGLAFSGAAFILTKFIKKITEAKMAALQAQHSFSVMGFMMKTAIPFVAVVAATAIVSSLWQAAENAKKLREELEELNKDPEYKIEENMDMILKEEKDQERSYNLRIKTMKKYADAIKDSNVPEERKIVFLGQLKRLMKEVTNEYPRFLDSLDAEKLSLKDGLSYWSNYEKAIDNSTAALNDHMRYVYASAKVRAAENVIDEEETNLVKQNNIINENIDLIRESTSGLNEFEGGVINNIQLVRKAVIDYGVDYAIKNGKKSLDYVAMSKKLKEIVDKGQISDATKEVLKTEFSYNPTLNTDVSARMLLSGEVSDYAKQYLDAALKRDAIEKNLSRTRKVHELSYQEFINLPPDNLSLSHRTDTPVGEREFGKGSAKSYTEYFELLKKQWERGSEWFKRDFSELDGSFETVVAREREYEKILFDKFLEIRNTKIDSEDKVTIDKFNEEFIDWFYKWKKDKFTRIMKVLSNRMKKSGDVKEQEMIKSQMNEIITEMQLALTQYQGFDYDDTDFEKVNRILYDKDTSVLMIIDYLNYNYNQVKKMYESDELPDGVKELPEFKKLKEVVSGKPMSIGEVTTKQLALWIKKQRMGEDYVITKEDILEAGLSDSDFVKGGRSDIVSDEVREIVAGTEFLNNVREKFSQWEEQTRSQFKVVVDIINSKFAPEEARHILENLGAGKWLSEAEFMLDMINQAETDMDRMMKEYTDSSGKPLIVNEFLVWLNKQLGIVDSEGLGKSIDDLSYDEIERLLAIPNLNSDVSDALNARKNQMDDFLARYDDATQDEIHEIELARNRHKKAYVNLSKRSKNVFSVFSFANMFGLFMDSTFDYDTEFDMKKKEAQLKRDRELLRLHDESQQKGLKPGDKGFVDMSKEKRRELELSVSSVEEEVGKKKFDYLKTSIDAMKQTWELYYQWQMDKIKEWYDKQIKIVDNRQKYEYRSTLWAEKEKEKLDKQREQKEKKLAFAKKAIAIAETTWNTIAGIMRLYKDFTWPIATLLAIPLASLGAASIATIEKQKFGKGGKIYGPSHYNNGVDINAEGGEFIFSRKATEGNEHILYMVQEMLKNGRSNFGGNAFEKKMDELIHYVKKIDIVAEFKGNVIDDIQLWKRTVKGQRLAKVM